MWVPFFVEFVAVTEQKINNLENIKPKLRRDKLFQLILLPTAVKTLNELVFQYVKKIL